MADENLNGIALEQLHPLEPDAPTEQTFETGYTHRQVQRFQVPIIYEFEGQTVEEDIQFKDSVCLIRDNNEERFNARVKAFETAVAGMHGADKHSIFRLKEVQNYVPVVESQAVRGAASTSSIKAPTQNKPVVPPTPTNIKIALGGAIQPK